LNHTPSAPFKLDSGTNALGSNEYLNSKQGRLEHADDEEE
jgi:hypothetical protein